MKNITRYKPNLITIDNSIISYETEVATIDHANKQVKEKKWEIELPNGKTITKSNTTTRQIKFVADKLGYDVIK
jgi:hypothetical protein